MPRSDRRASVGLAAEWAVAVVLLLTVCLYAYLGRFTSYVADDYTLKNDLTAQGYWGSQIYEYLHWTGRFAYIATVDAALTLNEFFDRLLPGLLLVLWVVAIAVALKAIVPTIGWLASLGLASGAVFTTVHITPSPFLSVYWMAGSLEYTAPLLLGTVFVALAAPRRRAGRVRIVVAAMVAFAAGGFNEAYALVQLILLVVMLITTAYPAWPGVRRSRSLILSGLVGAVLSLALLAAAPGNGARFNIITGIIGTRPTFLELPGVTIGFAFQFLKDVFLAHWSALLAMGGLAALVASRTPSPSRASPSRGLLLLVLVVVAAMAALVASFAPTAYVEARIAPIYGQIVPVYVGVGAIAIVGWALGKYVQSLFGRYGEDGTMSPTSLSRTAAIASVVLACLIATIPIQSAITIWEGRGALHFYAAAKDAQAALARSAAAAGRRSVIVPSVSAVNLGVFSHPSTEEMLPDPKWWINVGEATYYGVGSISAQG
ncbi:MAG: DUF6056 family protein [Candidatus Dormibacteria bacterium]